MRERGHQMEAICQPGSGLFCRLTDEGFTVHPLSMDGSVNYVKGVYRVWRLLSSGQYDVINTHSRRDTVIAAAAARLAGTPLIVRTRHLAKRPGSLWSYTGLPHKVIAVSDYVTQQLLARGVRLNDLDTVFTAVAPLTPAIQSTLRAELRIEGDALVIGCVGHLRPQKGHRLLLTAIAPLLTSGPDNHLVVAGDGSELESLNEQARALGCEGRVHFLGRRNDIENVLSGCDIFALATEFEALGTSFIEAAACGLPVVATSVGGVSEVVKHGETGLLVPYGDVDQLRDALDTLAADGPLRTRMGKAGAAYIRSERKFTIAGMAESVETAYSRWLSP
ncbi:glycosyltransferase involved in cell wall biosynthesis [Achromobacter marplatensis]|uniref:Glycosyltransferase involved in cell wall biosynthesis n=2 Tax=Achromobacter marplatensis TaxID=470868 RepID=A0ABX9GAM8_9BURK|nr:glycosyltransferase involved in cell wall biosynthesis [Achromobacter marplatensis]CAB3677310.1 D-inositol-3-phosphate glycosyltransferase [Achromobacter marplatensis]